MIRSKRTMLIFVLLLCAAYCGDSLAEDNALIDVADLRIRDPFVLTNIPNARYVMVASIGNRQRGAKGWECYTSKDLRHWQAPVTVFTPPAGAGKMHGPTSPDRFPAHGKEEEMSEDKT